MAFGLSSTGFERKRLADIKQEIEDDLRATFGPYINTLPASVFGQLIGVIAERESSIWELSEDVYNSQYPDTAEGASLDNVVALTGLTRQPATYSKVRSQLLFGTAATLVPAGTIFSVSGDATSRFVTDTDVTLVAGTDEVQNLAFVGTPASGTWKLSYLSDETSALAFNANAAAVQAALNALPLLSGVTVSGSIGAGFVITFAGADGKQNHPTLTVSQNSLLTGGAVAVTITPSTSTGGVPQGEVDCTAEATGPQTANAQTLSVIETPVSGLSSTRNPEDAEVGRDEETDLELRTRRNETLQVAGSGTAEAIRSRLLEIDGVTAAIVFENITMVTDADGRPAKSFEAVVQGGADQDIWNVIWASKPAGIRSYGSEDGTVVDSVGVAHTLEFSRPTPLNIYLLVTITVDLTAPSNAAQLVEDALVAYGNGLGIGTDVVVHPKLEGVLENFDWITDVVIAIGTAPAPTLDNNITVAANEIADFDSGRTTITVI